MCIIFSCIRDHCILNNGQVNESLVDDLQKLLIDEIERYKTSQHGYLVENERCESYTQGIIDSVKDFLVQTKFGTLFTMHQCHRIIFQIVFARTMDRTRSLSRGKVLS